jgi:hypothetical protein
MKSFASFVSVVVSIFAAVYSLGAAASDPTLPKVVDSGFGVGYIPDGFDSNDNVQIVGEGMYRSTCYKPSAVQVTIDEELKQIKVKPKAYYYEGFCLQMLVPFNQVIDLGLLKNGKYTVIQEESSEEPATLGSLKVKAATHSTPDDFLYAPVSQAYLDRSGTKARVKISGEFTNSCMRLVDTAVTVQRNVLVVQPVSELEERADCRGGKFPFEKTQEVEGVPSGRYLLHVRSLNGSAINTLVDLQ